ncbi:MAG: hypothetical protein E7185_03550 [Erysipelotrichaceae bacterium]|nr:hypothetical protein [Erysipelotrichaceae bacterium]
MKEFIRDILKDKEFMLFLTTAMSLLWNLSYACFNLWLAFHYKSQWFLTLAICFGFVGAMRLYVIANKDTEKHTISRIMKSCGIGICIMAVFLPVIMVVEVAEKQETPYSWLIAIVIAVYLFIKVIMIMFKSVKAYRKNNEEELILRYLSFIGVIGPLLSFIRIVFTHQEITRLTVTIQILYALAAMLVVLYLGITLIRRSGKLNE